MKITFLGTRGNITARSKKHYRHTITLFSKGRKKILIFEVEHALNAPAVGYRISDGKYTVFYVPDLVKIKQQHKALKKIKLYIGDGAIISRTLLIKKRGRTHIGHSPIAKQVQWCQKEKVLRAIFTHCGTEIVTGKPEVIQEKINDLEKEYNIAIQIAYDGMVVRI